jgi:hypothetical protein
MSNLAIEVHSLKAEQYSPLLETPAEGAANYDRVEIRLQL